MKDWNTVTVEELKELSKTMSDGEIAQLFKISVGKVRYKRNKYGITFKNNFYSDFVSENSTLLQNVNEKSKVQLLETAPDVLAKALTHYAFRNGPIEDMHENGQLSQDDMKTLNKYMANKLAGLICKIKDGKWFQIELLLEKLKIYGAHWDTVEPDTEDFDLLWEFYKKSIEKHLLTDADEDMT